MAKYFDGFVDKWLKINGFELKINDNSISEEFSNIFSGQWLTVGDSGCPPKYQNYNYRKISKFLGKIF